MKSILWVIFVVLSVLVKGILIHTFYGWFVVPHWNQAPNLSIAACLGLSYFIAAISPWWFDLKLNSDDAEHVLIKSAIATTMYIVVLFIGAAVIKFLM